MKSQKLSIADTKSFVGRLHNDCSPQQEIRELTVNSIQGVMRAAPKNRSSSILAIEEQVSRGVVIWDIDWELYDGPGNPKKLCIIDNGDGIEGNKMELFLNHLSSGIQARDGSADTNYGIGAKISALPLNQAGLAYSSWTAKDPNGNGLVLGLDSDDSYAILPMNGKIRTIKSKEAAPTLIKESGHGTKATMYGNCDSDDTMNTPQGASGGTKWISKYLNSKFWSLPSGVKLYAREWAEVAPRPSKLSGPPHGHPMSNGKGGSPNLLRLINGLQWHVEKHSHASGKVRLENGRVADGTQVAATAHWYVLKDDAPKSMQDIYAKGHVACIMKNNSVTEIYEPKYHTTSLMRFGVLDQHKRVFIMIEPDSNTSNLTTTAGRDALKVGKYRMPWEAWEDEFASKLPDAINDLYNHDSGTTDIREKLKKIHDFIENIPTFAKMSKLLKKRNVVENVIDEDGLNEFGGVRHRNGEQPTGPEPRPGPNIDPVEPQRARTRLEKAFKAAEIVEEETHIEIDDWQIPNFQWFSQTPNEKLNILDCHREDDGSTELEDRFAAYYNAPNLIRVNYDFRGFHHFLELMLGQETSVPKRNIITKQVMESFEISLAETILGIRSLTAAGGGTWSQQHFEKATSPEALTAAAMQRYHARQVLSRNVNRIIGKRSDDDSGQPILEPTSEAVF